LHRSVPDGFRGNRGQLGILWKQMNPIALYFASGESFYLEAALLLLVIAVSAFMKRPWLLRLQNVGAWLALAMVVMACPPFALVVDLIFLASLVLWFIASNRSSGRWLKSRPVATAVLVVLVLVLTAIEFSHRKMPLVVGKPSDHLVVIGDSISSGIDPRVPSWPLVLQQTNWYRGKKPRETGRTVEGRTDVGGKTDGRRSCGSNRNRR
jgi:hypothetical protein